MALFSFFSFIVLDIILKKKSHWSTVLFHLTLGEYLRNFLWCSLGFQGIFQGFFSSERKYLSFLPPPPFLHLRIRLNSKCVLKGISLFYQLFLMLSSFHSSCYFVHTVACVVHPLEFQATFQGLFLGTRNIFFFTKLFWLELWFFPQTIPSWRHAFEFRVLFRGFLSFSLLFSFPLVSFQCFYHIFREREREREKSVEPNALPRNGSDDHNHNSRIK